MQAGPMLNRPLSSPALSRAWPSASVVLAILCAVLIAGCALPGAVTSTPPTPPSALDPATQAPVRSIAYASVVVQPEGTLKQDLVDVIDQLGGDGAAAKLSSELTAGNTWSQVQPWLGQRVGVALVGLPPAGEVDLQSLLDYVVLIIPTSDPSAAASYLSSNLPSSVPGLTSQVVGNFAYVGGSYAIQVASQLPAARSLAVSTTYQRLMRRLPSEQLASFYVRVRPLVKLELAADAERMSGAELQAVRHATAGTDEGDEAVALTVTGKSVSLESALSNPPRFSPSQVGSVAGLPGNSWLALALGNVMTRTGKLFEAGFNQGLAQARASGANAARTAATMRLLDDDLIPALGPMAASVSGTTKRTLRAGIQLSPSSQAAGGRLLALIERMIGRRHTSVKLGQTGGKLVATFGYPSFADLLSPHRSLADEPTFKQATAQLPPHSAVDVFVNFGPLSRLLRTLDHNPKDAGVVRAASQLRYLIFAQGPNGFRLQLQLR